MKSTPKIGEKRRFQGFKDGRESKDEKLYQEIRLLRLQIKNIGEQKYA